MFPETRGTGGVGILRALGFQEFHTEVHTVIDTRYVRDSLLQAFRHGDKHHYSESAAIRNSIRDLPGFGALH